MVIACGKIEKEEKGPFNKPFNMHTRLLITPSFILMLLLCVMLLHAGTSKTIYCAENNGKLHGKTQVVPASTDFKTNSFLPFLLVF